jgi:hypothetical protein
VTAGAAVSSHTSANRSGDINNFRDLVFAGRFRPTEQSLDVPDSHRPTKKKTKHPISSRDGSLRKLLALPFFDKFIEFFDKFIESVGVPKKVVIRLRE